MNITLLLLILAAALTGPYAQCRKVSSQSEWDWTAGHHRGRRIEHLNVRGQEPTLPDWHSNATFEQPISHEDPALGTFSQFYFYDTTYWGGKGSPIILFTPGEVNATGYVSYLTTRRMTGALAQRIGAAIVVLEHRFWGLSSPFDRLTTENLQHLTLRNALGDMVHFATHVELPFEKASNAKDVPWIAIGGSYSGALVARLANMMPGTFWAYYASSAPVQSISNYWQYFTSVQEGMPRGCHQDVTTVVEYMDDILQNGSDDAVFNLKTLFNLTSLRNDDFMAALQHGPLLWQSQKIYDRSSRTAFNTWCKYIENSSDENYSGSDEAVDLQKALAGYAKWWIEIVLPGYCASYNYPEFEGEYNVACFDTHNASSPVFTDITLSNRAERQWAWMLCNEPFGFWQGCAPAPRPSIVSRLLGAEYWIRQCDLLFPSGPNGETFAKGRSELDVNAYTGGWDAGNGTRLIYVNGEYDPWREASVSARQRPGGPLQSSEQVMVEILPGGNHMSDLVTLNGALNRQCKEIQTKVLNQLEEWVLSWPAYWHHY